MSDHRTPDLISSFDFQHNFGRNIGITCIEQGPIVGGHFHGGVRFLFHIALVNFPLAELDRPAVTCGINIGVVLSDLGLLILVELVAG